MALFYNLIFNEAEGDEDPTDYTSDDNTSSGENTTGSDDTSDTAGNENDNPEDSPEDYTIPDDNDKQDDENQDNADEDQDTGEEDTEGDNADEGTDSEENDNTDIEDTDDSESNSDTDAAKIKELNDQIFSSFTPEQLAIKDEELKKRYFDMYVNVQDIIDRLNDIPKTEESLKILEFVSNKLDELAQILYSYMADTYATLSYIENEINFNKFIGTLNGIDGVLEDLKISISISNKKEKE